MRRSTESADSDAMEAGLTPARQPESLGVWRVDRTRLALAFVLATSVLTISGYVDLTSSLSGNSAMPPATHQSQAPLTDAEPTLKNPNSYDETVRPPKPFAYMFYITSDTYACAALHLMTHLQTNRSNIDLVVLHTDSGVSQNMLFKISNTVGAKTIAVDQILADAWEPTWRESLTKLNALREWGYERVVYIDSDAVPLQSLDHLFELPPASLYAARAYWLKQPFFASTLMVIEPSNARFEAVINWARERGSAAGFDMDILNAFFQDTVQYLPGDYTVLNSDFRAAPNAPNKLYATTTLLKQNTKLVHFSCKPDGSYGKPWSDGTHDLSSIEGKGFNPLFKQLYEDYWRTEAELCRS